MAGFLILLLMIAQNGQQKLELKDTLELNTRREGLGGFGGRKAQQ